MWMLTNFERTRAVVIVWIEGGTLDGGLETSKFQVFNFQLSKFEVLTSNFTFSTSNFSTMSLHNNTMFQPLIEKYQLKGKSEQETGANRNFVSVVF